MHFKYNGIDMKSKRIKKTQYANSKLYIFKIKYLNPDWKVPIEGNSEF